MSLARATVLAVLLVLAPLLAGCLSGEAPAALAPAEGADDPASRPALVPATFLPPIELGTVDLGAEPNVAVAPDGTVYVSTPLALWRSDDLGHTFQPLGERECTLPTCDAHNPGLEGGGDGSLAITPDGVVHWAGLGGGYGVPYQRSTDRGESWSDPVELGGDRDLSASDREWISADDDGVLYAVWRQATYKEADCIRLRGICYVPPGAEPTQVVSVNVSADGGATWNGSSMEGDAITGPVATDPTGDAIYLPANSPAGIVVRRSDDRGMTWTETVVRPGLPVFGAYVFPVAAVDAAGTVYVVWAEDPDNPVPAPDVPGGFAVPRTFARPHVYLAASQDGGASFSEPLLLSDPMRPAVFPWIAAGDAGRVAVSWYDAVAPIPSDRLPNVWNVAVAMSVTADQPEPVFETSLATPTPLHLGSVCTSGLFCSLTAGDRSLLDFFELRLLPDGSPVVAFAGDDEAKMATVKVYVTRMTEGTKLRG